MHPDNNMTLGPGRLYLTTPDGTEVPMGNLTTAEISLPTPCEDLDELAPPPTIQAAPATFTISCDLQAGSAWEDLIQKERQHLLQFRAMLLDAAAVAVGKWGIENRPKLFAIMARTKKRRTRKKYANRIYREFKAAPNEETRQYFWEALETAGLLGTKEG